MDNPYTAARAHAESELDRLGRLLGPLKEQEAAWNAAHGAPRAQATAPPLPEKRVNGAGLRAALNDGPPWPEAVFNVLKGGESLTVTEIVAKLKEGGRRFGEKTRPDAVVRNALKRGTKRYGLQKKGQPQRWSVKPSGQEVGDD